MNGPSVLDTRRLVLPGRITAIDALPDEAFITAVTLAELSVGPLVATTDDDRAARQAHLQAVEADFDPLPFDAMIAATGVSAGIPVHTCNPSDFSGIDVLEVVEVVEVPHPDHGSADAGAVQLWR